MPLPRPTLPIGALRRAPGRCLAFLNRLWRRPLFWAGVYLLLIPAFATAYWFLPAASFHDANSVREDGAYADAVPLRSALTRAIVTHLRGRSWSYRGDRLELSPKTIRVYALEYTPDDRLVIELDGDFAPVGRSPIAFGHFALAVEPSLREDPLISGPLGRLTYAVSVVQTLPGTATSDGPLARPGQPPVSLLFAPPGVALRSSPSEGGTLVMAPATYGRLLAFYLSLGGDPHYASDLWWRMLYLSAVTITTLGFGDITPITGTARALIGSEAVLGIVVIGVFLATLALYARRPNFPETPT
jgi:hypothetical protein